ncbi:hypothetical protein GCM10010387_47850 [Streptomyces inusitatus]|uniref:Uncharacterized protein n=1 Tax=Streptomyces inusitatus TaxID=68221 RepID=A0A918QGD3_9ACTN|nr:hypothetical protein [Streptomyces inusitatus]GGZ47910.1 hypothetical protein GCM10010387_47850 [Streptomyces inusitatus]
MSDANTNQPPAHEQQQAADSALIHTRYGATNAAERAAAILEKFGIGNGSGPGGFFGKTDFESARLNAMLDLLDSANPTDLENAGHALQSATKALNRAAKELDSFVKATDWKGESGDEFRRFGSELARYAGDLGTFANTVGTQMKVASEGLTSVRNSKPPRDARADPKKPDAFPPSERKDDNPEYKAAVKAEKDRQEAINQMNRLASFYAVSEQTLAGQEPPRLPKMLDAAVPRPEGGRRPPTGSSNAEAADATGSRALARGTQAPDEARVSSADPVAWSPQALPPSSASSPLSPSAPAPDTSMKIDSVTAPPAPTTTAPATSPGVPGGPATTQTPPVIAGAPSPVQSKVAQAKGASAAPKPGVAPSATAGGRPGAVGGAPAARYAEGARPGVMGAGTATPAGGGTAAGRAGAASPIAGGSPAAGRAGAAGGAAQPPMAGGAAGAAGQAGMAGRAGAGPSAGMGAGRANGIVGGTPQRAVGGSAGPRIPRGTVIGGEATAAGRPSAARPSQSGVIGAGPVNGSAQSGGRGTPSANGIVGTPRSGGAAPRSAAGGGFTTGGAGLVGRRSRQQSEEEQERSASARPDYLTEDEETWAVRRRAVPPVID